jgi:D-aminopeptidase
MRPYALAKPLTLEVSLKNDRPVELLGYLREVQRVDSHTVRHAAKDMLEVSRFLECVTNYNPTVVTRSRPANAVLFAGAAV